MVSLQGTSLQKVPLSPTYEGESFAPGDAERDILQDWVVWLVAETDVVKLHRRRCSGLQDFGSWLVLKFKVIAFR